MIRAAVALLLTLAGGVSGHRGFADPPPDSRNYQPIEPAPGYAAWFKADGITGLGDGDSVAIWEDASANNKDATQSTISFRPIYRTNVLNGKPALRFDGANDRLVSPGQNNIWGLVNDFTVFAVMRLDSVPGPGSQDVVGSSAISNNLDLFARRNDVGGNWLAHSSSHDGTRNSDLVLTPGRWYVLTWRLKVFQHLQIRAEKIYRLNDTGYSGIGTAPSQAAIGARQNGANPLKGNIAEVIFYSSNLSDANMEATEDYLRQKYGLPNPDELAHEERCELAEQVLMEGEPADLRSWALSYARGCEEQGGEVLAEVLRQHRDAQTQTGELSGLVMASVLSITDRAFFEAALEVATDPTAGERARVEAMRILYSQLHPGSLLDYEILVEPVPEGKKRFGVGSFSDALPYRTVGEPLPLDAEEQVEAALRTVAEDPSAPQAVREAAKKLS